MNDLNKTVTFKDEKPSDEHIKFLREMGLDVVIQEEEISKSLSVTKVKKAKVRELKRRILIEKVLLEKEKWATGEYL
ncbi:MAG: hypothetical protein COA90_07925 [Gammaproteobacteria bacterium]|nr:MAG: hypothetical protein COA90_07925 [Gammaproteobacteria bacterium]